MKKSQIKELERLISSISAHIDRGNIETAKVYLSEVHKILKEMESNDENYDEQQRSKRSGRRIV